MTIIAHGGINKKIPEYRPYIPDILIIDAGFDHLIKIDKQHQISEISKLEYENLLNQGVFEKITIPGIWNESIWVCCEHDGIRCFKIFDEYQWRLDRAKELINSLLSKTSVPLNPINVVLSAASLVEMDIGKFIQFLETFRSSKNESLDEIFQRIKNNSKMNNE